VSIARLTFLLTWSVFHDKAVSILASLWSLGGARPPVSTSVALMSCWHQSRITLPIPRLLDLVFLTACLLPSTLPTRAAIVRRTVAAEDLIIQAEANDYKRGIHTGYDEE
jgi:hypothetical protein